MSNHAEEGPRPRVLVSCPTFSGMQYALKDWADAYHAQTYPRELLGALQVDNSDGPQTGGNLHYLHLIRGQGIPAVWQTVRFPALWDTLELSWLTILEYAHDNGYEFVFSVEADVIVPPDATEQMVACAFEHGEDGRPALVTQRYHPRGQPGPDFWWDSLGCSLFPVEPLWEDRHLTKAIWEIECFIIAERRGYPRWRPGHDGPDLFIPEHLAEPGDSLKYVYGATPAATRYLARVMAANQEEPEPGNKVLGGVGVAQMVKHEAAEVSVPMGQVMEPEAPPDGAVVGEPYAGRRVVEDRIRAAEEAAPSIDQLMKDRALAHKIAAEPHLRLNLGSDRIQMSGFLSVDMRPEVEPDIVADVRDLSMIPDNAAEEVYASHVLEHLGWDDGLAALKEWLRVLKPGGQLTVAVPDVEQVYTLWKKGGTWGEYHQPVDDMYVQATTFGAHLLAERIPEMADQYGNVGHEHHSIYIRDMLLNRVIQAGYVYCHEVQACFLRKSGVGEVMVQALKPKQGD